MTTRVGVDGRHLDLDGTPFRIRGVTYGSFVTRADGHLFPDDDRIDADLAAMSASGLNTVRTYTLPPESLLEAAERHGLRVLVGIDHHDWRMEPSATRAARRRIREAGLSAVREAMERCSGRPSVLAIAVGNEIPVDLVRLHGIGTVEAELTRLIDEVHRIDPSMLATYVNFPTTEFLVPLRQDLACFNVFLEDRAAFRRYLRHLRIAGGRRPLVLTELGLAAGVHGEERQAESVAWQLEEVDLAGAAGATVFAWTDEWAVADTPVEGWGFGVTTADRRPKPALDALQRWAARPLTDLRPSWPRVSVVVCAYDAEPTIAECLDSLARVDYPDLEVIVCDDGSTDRTAEIARRYPFKVLELPHRGLSEARNSGWRAATGNIVAYLDSDAACHQEWPYHLALGMEDDVAGLGGPNIAFEDVGVVERAVALSPGNPVEVLVSDDRTEHLVGANMAFRPDALEEIDGFVPAYTSAGDDVDASWKLLDAGHALGFSPPAQVRHHRRSTVRGYLRQQRGYGRAERMLSGPHGHRFNRLGQARWSGFIYGASRVLPGLLRPVVYHGYQGHAPFQPIARRPAETVAAWVGALLPLTLPAALVGAALALFSLWFLAVTALSVAVVIAYGTATAVAAPVPRTESRPGALRVLVAVLHVLQPFARTWGRLRARALPPASAEPDWRGERSAWLEALRSHLAGRGLPPRVGGPSDPWDLEVRGLLATARLVTAVAWQWEPRIRLRRRPRGLGVLLVAASAALAPLSPWWIAGSGGLLVATGAEATVLARRVRRSVRSTTRGAAT